MHGKLPQRKRLRMEGYDYSSAGCYFVTIVTNDRQCLFGDVTNGTMLLNDAGKTIDKATRDIEEYDDSITVNTESHIVSLSTCIGSKPNNRWIVSGVLLNE